MAFLETEEISNLPAIDVKVNVCNTKLSDKKIEKEGKKHVFCSLDGCRVGLQNSCLCVGSHCVMRTLCNFALQLTIENSNVFSLLKR